MVISAFLLALTAHFLVNYGPNKYNGQVTPLSLLSVEEAPSIGNGTYLSLTDYNVSSTIPSMFLDVNPLNMIPTEESENSHLFKYSNTSLALDCYQKLPQYTVIIGLLKEYSYFLSVYYRLKCDNWSEYKDGTRCGDIPYVIDLLDNKAEVLFEKKERKERECFRIESNIISVQCRFYDNNGFVGRVNGTLKESEFVTIEQSYLRRVTMEYERLLINKAISYEVFCISKLDYDGTIDCYRLRLESWILENEISKLSEEYFKRTLRFKRKKDIV